MRIPTFGPQPWVMGVLNVTPDSFSDGGQWLDTSAAIARGRHLAAAGAAIVDVGGESTRPGAHRVDADTEMRRILPVIKELAADGVLLSVDTTRATVAEAAINAGAAIINDVSGGLADPQMLPLVREVQTPWILMHWRGPSDTMAQLAHYDDVVVEVRGELLARVEAAIAAGVDERSLIIDPGLGFAKTAAHNWRLLAHLDALVDTGLPVLIGASRKRFLGALLADESGDPRPPEGREDATAVISALAAEAGVWGVRVHEAAPTCDALAVVGQWRDQPLVAATNSPLIVATAPTVGIRHKKKKSHHTPSRTGGDHVTLRGLTVRGHHGVFDFEKRDGQDFVVDTTIFFDIARAAASDNVANTVNYAELADLIEKIVAGPAKDLIETVASDIAAAIIATFPVSAVEVTVHKPHAPIGQTFSDVAVTVRRETLSTER